MEARTRVPSVEVERRSKERAEGEAEIRRLDRREFLRLGAVAGGGLVLAISFPGCGWEGAAAAEASASGGGAATAAGADPEAAFQPNAFLRIDTDGTVTIWLGRAEMGQGVMTALPMIVAEELEADWERVRVVQADAHPEKYGRMMTVGSTSVRGGAWMPLRRAGAAAREMLVAAAAARWGVEPAACRAEAGHVFLDGSDTSLAYGELAEEAAAQPVPSQPRLKDPSEFRLIGTRVPQLDTRLKVTGGATFGADVRVPGMRYATVVRCPLIGGSVRTLDDSAARQVPGFQRAVEIPTGVLVVADHTWAAFQAARALEIDWNPGGFWEGSDEIRAQHAELVERPGAVARSDGNARIALSRAPRRVEAAYQFPYLAHATMEPMNCTAHVTEDRCEVWAPTQNPQGAQQVAARITGLPVERVTVHVTYMGCGWGRRGRTDYVEDAVHASRAVGGPVHVMWTREEDMRHDHYRPAGYARLEGGLDGNGRLTALSIRVAAPPVGVGWGGVRGGAVDPAAVDGLSNLVYGIPHLQVEYCRSEIPVPTGYWRSVGPSGNTFVLEGFMDELARAAGRDPLAFRLELLEGHPRMRRVLEVAAREAGWGTPPPEGRARGIGLVENKGGLVAEIAEVSIENGRPRVHRVTVAADCGQIIHPGIVEAQLSGSVAAGLSAALYGEITIFDGRVVQSNFHDYGMLRFSEMPEVDVHIIESGEEPGGVGEPAVPPVAPAVANAVYALTGSRVRTLPFGGLG